MENTVKNHLDSELKNGKWSILYYSLFNLIGKHKLENGKELIISYPEVCLLSIIISLNKVKIGANCTAKNFTFSEIMNAKERQIQVYLRHLKDLNVIYTFEERVKGSHCTTKRTIYVNYKVLLKLVYNKDDEDLTTDELYLKSNTETKEYIDNFLREPNINEDYLQCSQGVLHPNGITSNVVSRYIKSMIYKDFIKTIYWKCIAYEKKRISGFSCQTCNSKESLNVHHKTYNHHGEEHNYINNDLICLCSKCHSLFHNKSEE